jgi:predicted acylesterase/phospholipase RssA
MKIWILPTTTVDSGMTCPPQYRAIGFAGGGNRCYWQSGFWEAFSAIHPQKPDYFVAVSAGAYHCAMNIVGKGATIRAAAIAFAEQRLPDAEWRNLQRGRSPFVVGRLFDIFLSEMFSDDDVTALKAQPPILMQLAHPPTWMPSSLAALGSIGAYQIEKALSGGAHSKAGKYLGLTPSWVSTHDMVTSRDLVDAIMGTSSVPPFMPVGKVGGKACLDGGLVDNPPLIKLRETEAKGGRTLLLTTRFGRTPPTAPYRTVVGPSEDITVDKFTISDPEGLKAAYELGLRDGERFSKSKEDA